VENVGQKRTFKHAH